MRTIRWSLKTAIQLSSSTSNARDDQPNRFPHKRRNFFERIFWRSSFTPNAELNTHQTGRNFLFCLSSIATMATGFNLSAVADVYADRKVRYLRPRRSSRSSHYLLVWWFAVCTPLSAGIDMQSWTYSRCEYLNNCLHLAPQFVH